MKPKLFRSIGFSLFLFLLIPQICWGAELLVRAKSHWMDSLTQTEVDKMSAEEKQSYEARSQIGDVIVVRPDGWDWGKKECLPNYIVVKMPGINVTDVGKYTTANFRYDIDRIGDFGEIYYTTVLLKRRKFKMPEIWVNNYKNLSQSVVEIKVKNQQTTLINSIIEKAE